MRFSSRKLDRIGHSIGLRSIVSRKMYLGKNDAINVKHWYGLDILSSFVRIPPVSWTYDADQRYVPDTFLPLLTKGNRGKDGFPIHALRWLSWLACTLSPSLARLLKRLQKTLTAENVLRHSVGP